MHRSLTLPLLLLLVGLQTVYAQFQFFENMFGGHQQQQYQQQQRSAASQWAAYSDGGVLHFIFTLSGKVLISIACQCHAPSIFALKH